jgi:hypothetical protein
LPRSRSHDRRTNPRNKPQTIPKRRHEPRNKGLSCSAAVQADGPRPWGGLSATTTHGGRSVTHYRRTQPAPPHADGPRATRVARTVRDVPADCPPNHFPPKATVQPDRNEGAQEHAENTKNIWDKSTTRTVCTLLADCPLGAKTAARESTREHPTTYPSKDLPNT